MRESELERRFRRIVERMGGRAYKFVSPGNAGMPDRIVVLPGGRIGFIELKRPGETPGKLQRFRQEELSGLGCYTAVVDSAESAEAAIDELKKQTPVTHAHDPLSAETINRRSAGQKGVVL